MTNARSNKNRRGNRSDGNGGNPNAKNGAKTAAGAGTGGNPGAKNGNGKSGNGGGRQPEKGRSGSRRRKGSRKKQVDPMVFWGDPDQLAELGSERATITANPSAVVQSLGRPPLSGQQNAAEHYFIAVYERAVNLAAALAAAGDLLETDEPDDGPSN